MEKITIRINQTNLPLGHTTYANGGMATFKPKKGKGSYSRKEKYKSYSF